MYLDKIMVDGAQQRLTIFRTFVSPHGMSTMQEESLFAFPGELDLHARTAGMDLVSRTSGWATVDVSEASDTIVSV
ncbi:MAG: hypothetical protein B5766_12760 [Candidatus Lumbricidophila eiseniae]|uniref:Uncharacterized protein n=1 Tax=Candidatus Lumbricidiphila eiseniae TaxID=1969409 RepID=A0A2A6FN49_9MICO|nr:MAG: hypothetical protein B5766_12760 [Candidatus Lumbricidophila eiseniae]